jgi:hypothetical protein
MLGYGRADGMPHFHHSMTEHDRKHNHSNLSTFVVQAHCMDSDRRSPPPKGFGYFLLLRALRPNGLESPERKTSGTVIEYISLERYSWKYFHVV